MTTNFPTLTVYHIPVCPFCQRLEILLELKGLRDQVKFVVIDITKPREAWLLEKTRGTTALPVLETSDGKIIKESMVIMQYLDDVFSTPRIAQSDPYRRAIENMLTKFESEFCMQGYVYVMNQDPARRDGLRESMLKQYAKLNQFLMEHAPESDFLFENFGWAEAVFTPFFMRFWFLDYYEEFELPDVDTYRRVRRWRDVCLAHPAAQQTSKEEIVKVYYDYAKGAGNGALLPGRTLSSFSFTPDWRARPWPPRNKYEHSASDQELGLLA
ncbi:glutathione S-transferase family protein [Undibacterium cyanobacteriorum]|uniref:Glutathione S-transferase family protein n=1 Tax=Undibacterium cyanobacteriorum TaxID=3073561 RepID=A0ABY9RKS9_9BURK|nr:glutathione S-transferase family protein [Undibacterium sp. 20NA77.5]WMW81830.1 glutathione S-transferase family protein [Undibacterium sp. 20NA77.5]